MTKTVIDDDAIKSLIDRIDFDSEELKLRAAIDPQDGKKPLSAQRKQKAIKRLKIVSAFNRRDENGRRVNDPRAMILDAVPVLPPMFRTRSPILIAWIILKFVPNLIIIKN